MTDFELTQKCDELASMGFTYWPEINELGEQAQSVETRCYIGNVVKQLIHREEVACEIL